MSGRAAWVYALVGVAVVVCSVAAAAALVSINHLEQMSAFSTDISARSSEQMHNITQAASAIDGTIVKPGEEFSFKRTVGVCDAAHGYRQAPAIVDGKLSSEWGGGVCQVSSTLYNAALLAGLPITERHAHSSPVASVSPGRDATYVFGAADLRFRNDTGSLLKIKACATGSKLTVRISGKVDAVPDVEVFTKTDNASTLLRTNTQNPNCAGLHPNVRELTVHTFRVTHTDDELARQELVSTDVYAIPGRSPGNQTR